MPRQSKRMGGVESLATDTPPAHEHGSKREFMVTVAELRDPNYDTAPLLAWLGADWIANGYRVISEYRVAIPQSSTATGARQSDTSTISESA